MISYGMMPSTMGALSFSFHGGKNEQGGAKHLIFYDILDQSVPIVAEWFHQTL
jgi:hypothetical protein